MPVPRFVFLDEKLSKEYIRPKFDILEDNAELSEISFFQPKGVIQGAKKGVENLEKTLEVQIEQYLNLKETQDAHLAILPEYCCPWSIIEKINEKKITPSIGRIWVFGFQSIDLPKLRDLKEKYTNIDLIFDEPKETQKEFVSPVCYIFSLKHLDGRLKTVCIVQFKTHFMSDTGDFEKNYLICGDTFYILRNEEDKIRLSTLICADTLNNSLVSNFRDVFPDWATRAYWLLHLQLNPNPRSSVFKKYRDDQLGDQHNTDKKAIFCANWAQGTVVQGLKTTNEDFGKSTLFLKGHGLRVGKNQLEENHIKGLYYTHAHTRTDAFFLNFSEAVFCLKIGKLSRTNVGGVFAALKMPKLDKIFLWDGKWVEAESLNDYSASQCPWRLAGGSVLDQTLLSSPVKREVLILKSCGYLGGDIDDIPSLSSMNLQGNEAIRRLTYLQDINPESLLFRNSVFGQFRTFRAIVLDETKWPLAIRSVINRDSIGIKIEKPFMNMNSTVGSSLYAIYIGEVDSEQMCKEKVSEIERVYTGFLRKFVHIWASIQGQIIYVDYARFQFDDPESVSIKDFTGV